MIKMVRGSCMKNKDSGLSASPPPSKMGGHAFFKMVLLRPLSDWY